MWITIFLSLTVLAAIWFWTKSRRQNLPPGPKGIPFVGNTFQLDPERPHFTLAEWASKYGDVFTIRMFGNDIVVVQGGELTKEVLVTKSKDFAGRPYSYRFWHISLEGNDVLFTDYSKDWEGLKKTGIKSLKMYGEGLRRLEEVTHEVALEFLEELAQCQGQPVDPYNASTRAIVNVLLTLITGKKTLQNSVDFTNYLDILDDVLKSSEQTFMGFLLDKLPSVMKYLPTKEMSSLNRVRKNFYDSWLAEKIDECKQSSADENEIQGILGSLVQAQKQGHISEAQLNALLMNLIIGGVFTSTSPLLSFQSLMVNYPDVQRKLQHEVDTVLGDRHPTLEDRDNMQLMEATIFELLRYCSQNPLSIPHKALVDSSIGGYQIPKGTEIWLNLFGTHHDNNVWEDAETFNPERFLDDNGKLIPPDHPLRKEFYAFGAGRRNCLGENLGKTRLFFLFSMILQKFNLEASDEGMPDVSTRNFIPGTINYPPRFKARYIPRNL